MLNRVKLNKIITSPNSKGIIIYHMNFSTLSLEDSNKKYMVLALFIIQRLRIKKTLIENSV